MADAIKERIEELTDPKVREVLRNQELRITALEEGTVAELTLPNSKWTKPELQAELDRRGIAWTAKLTHDELLELLKP